MHMGRNGVVVLVMFLLYATAVLAQTIRAPLGKPVMLDGKIQPGEWSDATSLPIPNGGRFYVKTSKGFVYIAVQLPDDCSGFTDLYVAPGSGGLYDLHASAKLGERRVQDGKWGEWHEWWNNNGWVANVSRVDSFDKRTFLPAKVREYQMERARFGGLSWRVMVGMSLESRNNDYTVVRFPASASDSNTDQWLQIMLGD